MKELIKIFDNPDFGSVRIITDGAGDKYRILRNGRMFCPWLF